MLKDPSNSGNRLRYSELNREVKNAVKQVKRRNFEEKVKFLEDQFRKHDSHNLFKTVKELEGKPKKKLNVIKDENGVKQFQQDKVLALWKEHFEKHLNTSFEHDEAALKFT